MSETRKYFRGDITNRKTAYEALNLVSEDINNLSTNLATFKFWEQNETDTNTYHYVMQRLNQIDDRIQELKDYYEKATKKFNQTSYRPNNVKKGFISFEER